MKGTKALVIDTRRSLLNDEPMGSNGHSTMQLEEKEKRKSTAKSMVKISRKSQWGSEDNDKRKENCLAQSLKNPRPQSARPFMGTIQNYRQRFRDPS
jgi:hypothetical protein